MFEIGKNTEKGEWVEMGVCGGAMVEKSDQLRR